MRIAYLAPLALLLTVSAAIGQETGEAVLVDRIVAVVDDDAILLSDIRRAIALGQIELVQGETPEQLDRRVLDGLIDQRLRLHEVERYNFDPLPVEEIDLQVEQLRAGFEGDAAFRENLQRLGLDEEALRSLVARQLRVLVYVERRLGPRVFVDLDDVRAYYDEVLTSEMARRGEEPPPLEEVSEEIRALLTERQLNEEIESWTEELRRKARILDYLERGEVELPPVVRRIE